MSVHPTNRMQLTAAPTVSGDPAALGRATMTHEIL